MISAEKARKLAKKKDVNKQFNELRSCIYSEITRASIMGKTDIVIALDVDEVTKPMIIVMMEELRLLGYRNVDICPYYYTMERCPSDGDFFNSTPVDCVFIRVTW